MKASARNQLAGKVSKVDVGAVYAEVSIALKGGDTLEASLTKDSCVALGLQPGADVLALIKAPLIMVVTDFGGYRLSARNQLKGTVTQIVKGAVNSEVVIELPGGDALAAVITNESLEALDLKQGAAATAVFKAGAVILGVAGA
jgi:molybdate transport system regulatory protein